VDGRPQVPNGYGIALAVVSTFQHKSALGPDEAIDSLSRAILLGYDDLSHMETDPDLESLRDHPDFRALLDTD
jgi:hypothetical protein